MKNRFIKSEKEKIAHTKCRYIYTVIHATYYHHFCHRISCCIPPSLKSLKKIGLMHFSDYIHVIVTHPKRMLHVMIKCSFTLKENAP